MRTETKILVSAMYELASSVQCDDGVANSAIAEAAQRLDEQNMRINMLETETEKLKNRLQQIRDWYDRDGSVGGLSQLMDSECA